ncbi:MAG TPA: Uma2 family endonuclease [Terriglobia bacterium]|nr:Uma2 family endonuclease [Terriglobia bacterium]
MGVELVTRLTYEQFRQLPDDGKRYELVRGEAHLNPAPTTKHQLVSRRLVASLEIYLSKNPLGEILYAPLDVRLSSDTALQPDIIFVAKANAAIIKEDYLAGAPDLVVEILSPSTTAHDRIIKLPIYAEAGVGEVWFIDPQASTVEVFKLQRSKYLVEAALAGNRSLTSTLFPGWELPLSSLFDFRGWF